MKKVPGTDVCPACGKRLLIYRHIAFLQWLCCVCDAPLDISEDFKVTAAGRLLPAHGYTFRTVHYSEPQPKPDLALDSAPLPEVVRDPAERPDLPQSEILRERDPAERDRLIGEFLDD